MKRLKRFWAIHIVLILVSSCTKQEITVPAELTNNTLASAIDVAVDQIYSENKDNLNTVGVSIGILKDGKTYFYGYGETKKGTGTIPDENTFFEIGSITKTFTATMAADMLLQNGLDVETPIKSYLPNDLPTLNRNGIEVNFKHLLTHTSGLPRMPSNFPTYSINPAKAYAKYDDRLLFSFLENVRLRSDPFTKYSYSNVGVGTVGVLLERNYGMDYGEVLHDKLTGPLNLTSTTTYFDDPDVSKWAMGYLINGKESEYWKSLNAMDGAGGIKSTAKDLLLYAKANINPPNTPLGDAIRLTHNVYFTNVEENNHYKTRNCLGWFEYVNTTLPDETFLWHNGATGGFISDVFISLDKESAVVVLFNKRGVTEERQAFIDGLLQLITE